MPDQQTHSIVVIHNVQNAQRCMDNPDKVLGPFEERGFKLIRFHPDRGDGLYANGATPERDGVGRLVYRWNNAILFRQKGGLISMLRDRGWDVIGYMHCPSWHEAGESWEAAYAWWGEWAQRNGLAGMYADNLQISLDPLEQMRFAYAVRARGWLVHHCTYDPWFGHFLADGNVLPLPVTHRFFCENHSYFYPDQEHAYAYSKPEAVPMRNFGAFLKEHDEIDLRYVLRQYKKWGGGMMVNVGSPRDLKLYDDVYG